MILTEIGNPVTILHLSHETPRARARVQTRGGKLARQKLLPTANAPRFIVAGSSQNEHRFTREFQENLNWARGSGRCASAGLEGFSLDRLTAQNVAARCSAIRRTKLLIVRSNRVSYAGGGPRRPHEFTRE